MVCYGICTTGLTESKALFTLQRSGIRTRYLLNAVHYRAAVKMTFRCPVSRVVGMRNQAGGIPRRAKRNTERRKPDLKWQTLSTHDATPASVTPDWKLASSVRCGKPISDGGRSGSKIFERGHDGAYGGVWWSLESGGLCLCVLQKSCFIRREDVFAFKIL